MDFLIVFALSTLLVKLGHVPCINSDLSESYLYDYHLSVLFFVLLIFVFLFVVSSFFLIIWF